MFSPIIDAGLIQKFKLTTARISKFQIDLFHLKTCNRMTCRTFDCMRYSALWTLSRFTNAVAAEGQRAKRAPLQNEWNDLDSSIDLGFGRESSLRNVSLRIIQGILSVGTPSDILFSANQSVTNEKIRHRLPTQHLRLLGLAHFFRLIRCWKLHKQW